MGVLHITDLEAAINWWRARSPSTDGISACREVRALAEVYALMVYYHDAQWEEQRLQGVAREAFLTWYAQTPDSPCIAICSTPRGMPSARAVGAALPRCGIGPSWTLFTSGPSGVAFSARAQPGASTATPSAIWTEVLRTTPHHRTAPREGLSSQRQATARHGLAGLHRSAGGAGLFHRRHLDAGPAGQPSPGGPGRRFGGLCHGVRRPDGRGAGHRPHR